MIIKESKVSGETLRRLGSIGLARLIVKEEASPS